MSDSVWDLVMLPAPAMGGAELFTGVLDSDEDTEEEDIELEEQFEVTGGTIGCGQYNPLGHPYIITQLLTSLSLKSLVQSPNPESEVLIETCFWLR